MVIDISKMSGTVTKLASLKLYVFVKLYMFSQAVITLLDCCANLPSTHAEAGTISWEFKQALWPKQFMANCVLLRFKSSSYLLINWQGVGAQEMWCSSNTGMITGGGHCCGRQRGIPRGPCAGAEQHPWGLFRCAGCVTRRMLPSACGGIFCWGSLTWEMVNVNTENEENIFSFRKNQHGIN